MAAVVYEPVSNVPFMGSVDFADLEVEGILNDIGLFTDEKGIFTDEKMLFDTTTIESRTLVTEEASSSFIPVSPDHREGALSPEPAVSTSSPVENFSVNNSLSSHLVTPTGTPKTTLGLKEAVIREDTSTQMIAKKAPQKSRKRKLSSDVVQDPKELTEEQIQERRYVLFSPRFHFNSQISSLSVSAIHRERNREHAKRSRQRKKAFTGNLQQSVEELKAENKKLREQVYALLGKAKVDSIIREKKAYADESFLAVVKNPKNRVLDSKTISFLKSLQKNLRSDT